MSVDPYLIAKKYVVAFFTAYREKITKEYLAALAEVEEFLKTNKDFYIALRIPSIPLKDKEAVLAKLADHFHLGDHGKKLFSLLLAHGRIELLDKVLRIMPYCFNKLHKIENFLVSTSHELNDEEKEIVAAYIDSISDAQTKNNFRIDPTLIVGLRIESMTYLWERSIRKELADVQKSFLRKG